MKRVLDMLVVISGSVGTVGLCVVALTTPSITPQNADVYMARALLILAGVIIPFLMARSLEKLDLRWPKIRLVPQRTRPIRPETVESNRPTPQADATQNHAAQPGLVHSDAQKPTPESAPTPYFDYLFQLDAASPSTSAQSRRRSRGDAHFTTH